jgi:hypothetical protein
MNAALEREIIRYLARDYRVIWSGHYSVIMARSKPTNTAFHLFATFFTCGLWLIPWLILETSRSFSNRQIRLELDEAGNVHKVPLVEGPFDHDYNRFGIHEGFFRTIRNFREAARKAH